jgi:hypothetical protein
VAVYENIEIETHFSAQKRFSDAQHTEGRFQYASRPTVTPPISAVTKTKAPHVNIPPVFRLPSHIILANGRHLSTAASEGWNSKELLKKI